MKYIVGISAVLLILFSFISKETPIQPLKENDAILAFGDSLTYGFGADTTEGYPVLLAEKTGHQVINAGVNGDTSADGLRRLPPLLENKNIKLMILFFGGNDILQKKSMDTLKQNLKTMIQMAKQKKIDVLLISLPEVTLFGLSPLALYEEISQEENIPLLDGMMADILANPTLKSDQIHPNAKGYSVIAEEIYNKLQEEGWI